MAHPSMWKATNDHADCLLSANPPAYRASVEQARNLLRIMDAMGNNHVTAADHIGDPPRVVHFAPLWGHAATTTYGMTESAACHAFLHTIARDLVSAAVRMNLLGPMEGQIVLWKELLPATKLYYDPSASQSLDDATTAAPALEAIQPCHDLLATRLFRS
jgi:urease accessory protein UreF